MPIIIGLTGSLGSGKSTVADMLKAHGARVIDADAITRRLLDKDIKIRKEVAKLFPHAILASGEIDRQGLAKLVFKNPRTLKKLTNVLYPAALKEVKRQILKNKRARFVVLDVPLLFESGWDSLADVTVVVKASLDLQVKRIQQRMGLTRADILRRLKVQMPQSQKLQKADIIIDNRFTLKQTRTQVDAMINRLNKRIPKTEK